MNWVKPEFSDFLVPSKKRLRSEDVPIENKVRKLDQSSEQKQELNTEILEKLTSISKYCPRRKEELVINKKKIEEVEFFLRNINKGSTYLIVTGPPGCGKYQTVRVLCNSLKIDCVEWVSPMNHSFDYDNANNSFYRSELELFEDFVIRACRYKSVFSSTMCRLILVKDIPSTFCRNNSVFHDLLDKFYKIDSLHIFFIFSDVSLARNLFPEQIKNKFGVQSINFNPVTQKNIHNLLLDLIKRFELQKVNRNIASHLEKICIDCNGDIRNAITTLHFLLAGQSANLHSLPVQKRKRQKGNKSKVVASSSSSNTVPDNKIDIFHGLGRILYAKKENNKLVHNPQEVAEAFITSPQLFVGMLHENYLTTFSSIHDIAKASLNLVTSDLLLEDWNSNSQLLGCGVSVAAYGLMTTNSNPIRKFQQFNKPQSKLDGVIQESINVIETYNPIWRGIDIALDIAPFVKSIPYFEFPCKELINKLGSFKRV